MVKLLKALKERLSCILLEERSGVIVIEITIHDGGIRGWNFFKKNKI